MQIAIILSAVVVGAVVAFGLLFPAQTRAPGNAGRERRVGSTGDPFHAVSIHPGHEVCASVKAVQDQRFLSEEAPGLPLPDCGANCNCRYVHHVDRRSGARDRRLSAGDLENPFWGQGNRRRAPGRRHTDLAYA